MRLLWVRRRNDVGSCSAPMPLRSTSPEADNRAMLRINATRRRLKTTNTFALCSQCATMFSITEMSRKYSRPSSGRFQKKEQLGFAASLAGHQSFVDLVTPSGISVRRREGFLVSFERLRNVVQRTALGLYSHHFREQPSKRIPHLHLYGRGSEVAAACSAKSPPGRSAEGARQSKKSNRGRILWAFLRRG